MDLRAQLEKLVTDMGVKLEILSKENRDFTEDEQTAYDAQEVEAKSLRNRIKRQDEFDSHDAIQPRVTQDAQHTIKADSPIVAPSFYRYNKLKAFKGKDAELNAYQSGMVVAASLFNDETAKRYCKDNGLVIKAAQEEGVNTKGGSLVPDEMEKSIIDLREEYGVARQWTKVVPMASDTKSTPRRTGGLTAYFTDERGAITESEKSWDSIGLTAKKLATLTRISSEFNEDAIISVVDDLASEIAYAFAVKEDDCLINGTGASTYGGIVGVLPKIIDGTHTAGAVDVATATHNLFSEIDATDLTTMMAALPKYALRTAAFYCSQVCYSMVFSRLMQAAGGNTIADLQAGAQLQYMGFPVKISQSMPAGVATDYDGLAMLLFGDMSLAARLGTRRGTSIAVSSDRYFDTDEVAIRGTERFDINVHDLGDTSTAGPLVALVGSSS